MSQAQLFPPFKGPWGPIMYDCGNREDWLKARRHFLTGTDAAKVMGLSKFGGPIDVYMEKTGKAPPDVDPNSNGRESGRRFERAILQWYSEREQVPIVFTDPFSIRRSPVHERIGATLDALRIETVDLEVPVDAKNIRRMGEDWGVPGTDQMPLYYATQLIVQMHVTGAPFADLAVVFSGQDFETYRIHRDANIEGHVIGTLLEFWEKYIESDTPPPIDGSESYTKYLALQLKQQSERVIVATIEQHVIARALHAVLEQTKALEQEETLYKNQIRAGIGEQKTLMGANWRANWTQAKDSKVVDWEAVAVELNTERALAIAALATVNREKAEEVATKALSLAQWVEKHTSTKAGSRRLTFNYDPSNE